MVSAGREAPVVETTSGGRSGWLLRTARSAMLLSVTGEGALLLDHWGGGAAGAGDEYLPDLPGNRRSQQAFLDGVPQAYAVYGEPSFKEPCLCVRYPDGTRIARPRFTGAAIAGPELRLSFTDPGYGLVVEHRFLVRPENDVVERSVRLANTGERPIDLERAASAALGFPPGEYQAWTLHGRWGAEFGLTRRPLLPGKFVTESRRGFTSYEANPWFAVTPAGEGDQERGRVWFGALAWSGNWSLVFETERNAALHLVAGISPFDFGARLDPGEELTTPPLVCGYTEGGLGGASRALHRYQVAHVLPANHRDTLRPVHYNSWFSTYFEVTAEHQIALARRAATLGFELFVVDDGWFGARDGEHAGLGDWVANPAKFPRGLGELVDEVHRLGMQFGIWVEPEMVSPDSDLYRAHPEWTLHVAGREPTLARHQLVLNLARDDVRAYLLDQLRALLSAHRIDYLKVDHNRPYTEVDWPDAPPERRREVWVRHVQGVYQLIDQLRREFPELLVETCAGGGGRVDLGILARTDQAWVSDNTDPADRLHSQYGFSLAYPARTMANWVTDDPNPATGRCTPLEFRFHVAMQGVLGVSADILAWSEDECRRARELIAEYRRLRPVIQQGEQFWLAPPAADGPCAVGYVSPDRREAVIFIYQARGVVSRSAFRLRAQGLDPGRRYRRTGDGVESTGSALMTAGFPVSFPPLAPKSPDAGDWQSAVHHWRAVGD